MLETVTFVNLCSHHQSQKATSVMTFSHSGCRNLTTRSGCRNLTTVTQTVLFSSANTRTITENLFQYDMIVS